MGQGQSWGTRDVAVVRNWKEIPRVLGDIREAEFQSLGGLPGCGGPGKGSRMSSTAFWLGARGCGGTEQRAGVR